MNENQAATPPTAPQKQLETTVHGVTLRDDYGWLRDKANSDTAAYLEAENAYAEALMAPEAALREQLYDEMLSHIKQTDVSVPYRDGQYWYYTRTEEGKQYGISCRKIGLSSGPLHNAPEEVLLDGNVMAEGHPFFAIGAVDVSDDGRWLAYTVDYTGFRQYTLYVKDLETGEMLPARWSAWDPWCGPRTIARCFTPWKTRNRSGSISFVGTCRGSRTKPTCWFTRRRTSDSTLAAGRTRDGSVPGDGSAATPPRSAGFSRRTIPGEFTVIAPREDEHEYYVDHRNGLWFIRTNDAGAIFAW